MIKNMEGILHWMHLQEELNQNLNTRIEILTDRIIDLEFKLRNNLK